MAARASDARGVTEHVGVHLRRWPEPHEVRRGAAVAGQRAHVSLLRLEPLAGQVGPVDPRPLRLSGHDADRRGRDIGGSGPGEVDGEGQQDLRMFSAPERAVFAVGRASPSTQRARIQSSDDRRLRYGQAREPSGTTGWAARSARRTTVRARSRRAELRSWPGTTNSAGSSKRLPTSTMTSSTRAHHRLGHEGLPLDELRAVLGLGCQLGHQHPEVTGHSREHHIELRAARRVGTRHADGRLRLVGGAHRLDARRRLRDTTAVEQASGAVVPLAGPAGARSRAQTVQTGRIGPVTRCRCSVASCRFGAAREVPR